MSQLSELKVGTYRENEAALSDPEIAGLKPQVPDWRVTEKEGIKGLERAFKFADFAQALAFTDQIGRLAEAENHHPAVLTEWGKVTVTWSTHKVHGLHKNDFIMAAKTDEAFGKKRE
jgi:4a-hydroxytetrahydrobiopterin dehydratase